MMTVVLYIDKMNKIMKNKRLKMRSITTTIKTYIKHKHRTRVKTRVKSVTPLLGDKSHTKQMCLKLGLKS